MMALTALMAASCSQNEVTEMNPDAVAPIGFGVYTGVQTKGEETTTGTIQSATGGFGILAYYTGQDAMADATTPNFMYNQKVTYTNPDWAYTPLKYWPTKSGDKVSFFAYAPYESAPDAGTNKGVTLPANSKGGWPTLKFTVKSDPVDMVDLVANKVIDRTKNNEAVSFTLAHVLSRASFDAKPSVALVDKVSYVMITDMKIVGKTSSASTANASSKFYTTATYKWGATDVWDYAGAEISATDYSLTSILNRVDQKTAVGNNYTTPAVAVTNNALATNLFAADKYLFFIPVNNATGTAADDVKVSISYDIVTVDNALENKFSATSNTVVVSLPAGTLKQGVAYKYTFTIGLTAIKVSATVTPWGDETPGNITL